MSSPTIGIDLGCTNIKGVLIDPEGNVLREEKHDTLEQDDQHWKGIVSSLIRKFKAEAGGPVKGIGLSAPGLANIDNNCIAFMPGRLPGLENFTWSDWIGERVYVLNDAHAAMMAEALFGAAKGLQHAVLITLGTGVGGGILINGQLYQGVSQMAGHIGHTTVDAGSDRLDVTNMPGSIEDAIGNVTLTERSQGKYHSTEELVNGVRQGNDFAKSVWMKSVQKLAVCVASMINVLSPEVVILSGGITQAENLLLDPLQEFLALYEWRPGGKRTPVRIAHFSDRAGAIGAAGFALSKMK